MTTWSPLYMAPVGLFSCHCKECNINLNRWQSAVIFHSDNIQNALDRSSLQKKQLAWYFPNLNMLKYFVKFFAGFYIAYKRITGHMEKKKTLTGHNPPLYMLKTISIMKYMTIRKVYKATIHHDILIQL